MQRRTATPIVAIMGYNIEAGTSASWKQSGWEQEGSNRYAKMIAKTFFAHLSVHSAFSKAAALQMHSPSSNHAHR